MPARTLMADGSVRAAPGGLAGQGQGPGGRGRNAFARSRDVSRVGSCPKDLARTVSGMSAFHLVEGLIETPTDPSAAPRVF